MRDAMKLFAFLLLAGTVTAAPADGAGLTPLQLIWSIVAACVFVILFTLYHMMLAHGPKKQG